MIENLNSLSIKPYGKVSNQGFDNAVKQLGFKLIKQRLLTNASPNGVYINHDSLTVIDIIEGCCIIYIGLEKDSMTPFWIDKTIILNKNVYFFITPLLFSCVISTSSETAPVFEEYQIINDPLINPNINITKILTLFYQEKELNFNFRGERHDFWELTYVDKGTILNKIDNTEYTLNQGQLILFAPGQYHSQKSIGNNPVSFLTISFMCEKSLDVFLSNKVITTDNEIKALLEKLLYEKQNPKIYSDDMLLCYLKEILIMLIRNIKIKNLITKADTRLKLSLENDITNKVKDYISKHIRDKITVNDIAKSIPISNSYLSTLFKKTTGYSLSDYINAEKINFAKTRLRTGKYSATEVSNELSFSSIHYFTKVFKKITGYSPGEYGKSLKE